LDGAANGPGDSLGALGGRDTAHQLGNPVSATGGRDPAHELGDPVGAPQRGHPEGPSRHEGEPVGRGAPHHDAVDGLLQAPDPDHLDRRGRGGGAVGRGASVFLGEIDLDDLDLGGEATEGGRCGGGGGGGSGAG